MSIDLSRPVVASEGNLDPIDGYVTYRLLQETSEDKNVLKDGSLFLSFFSLPSSRQRIIPF